MNEIVHQKKDKKAATDQQNQGGIATTTYKEMQITTVDTSGNASLEAIYPSWNTVEPRESGMVGLPAASSAYFTGAGISGQKSPADALGLTSSQDSMQIIRNLPKERIARYAVLDLMAQDPTIDSALKMHIANALNAKTDSAEAVFIKSVDGKKNEIVDSLNAALMPTIRRDLNEWARKAAVFGGCYVRVYGKQKEGITNLRCDYYTKPAFIQKYEKGGKLAGYTTSYQGTNVASRGLRLLPPWTFVGFEIPEWTDTEHTEPINISGVPVDLSIDQYEIEGLVEAQDYGTSLIATAYGPWLDLLDALCSLKMSRRNAARLERLVAVNTGRLDPERAAKYLDMIAERISNASTEIEKQSWLNGNVQTVVNHIFPVFSEKGSMQVETVQGTPDINGLEDVMFHIKRLGSALGVDPALLGFSDMLSGGLGDGGFFRVSVMAAVKANLLRSAICEGLQKLCEIHTAWKYGKVFMPGEYPWQIEFNAVSSALEREETETLESRTNAAGGIIGILATLDQEFAFADKRKLVRTVWDFLKMPSDNFDDIFPEGKAEAAEKAAQEAAMQEEE